MAVTYQDYYETLGVPRTAAPEDIRRAYRTLARKHHPDVNKDDPQAEARFKRINEAYEALKDPDKRARYDALGSGWRTGQEFRPPPGFEGVRQETFTFNFGPRGGASGNARATEFSDFFEMLFGQMAARMGNAASKGAAANGMGASSAERAGFEAAPGAMANNDVLEVEIPLERVIHGGPHTVRVDVPGLGPRAYELTIPRGIPEGRRIRLAGQGKGGGDLFLTVRHGSEAGLRAQGADLELDAPLTPAQAALGARVAVETPDGKLMITVPAGSPSGRRLRLRGHGLPTAPDSPQRGDLYVRLMVQVPKDLTDRQRELYEALHAEDGEPAP